MAIYVLKSLTDAIILLSTYPLLMAWNDRRLVSLLDNFKFYERSLSYFQVRRFNQKEISSSLFLFLKGNSCQVR
jgi:hypothetical protein